MQYEDSGSVYIIVIDEKYWLETWVKYYHGYVTSKQLQLTNLQQVHYYVHKWSQLDFFLSQLKPVHKHTPYFFTINLTIMLPFESKPSIGFSYQICTQF
jgi:hypothetical protein